MQKKQIEIAIKKGIDEAKLSLQSDIVGYIFAGLTSLTKPDPVVDFVKFFEGLSELQKATFKQYLEYMNPESLPGFKAKLESKSKKDLKAYLCDLLDDSELNQLEDDIYTGTTESRKSRNEDLYGARETEDSSGRILLYQAVVKKLGDKSSRTYVYGTCFRLNLDKLREIRSKSETKFRETVYKGFIDFIKRMNKKQFQTFVENIFLKDTATKQVFIVC